MDHNNYPQNSSINNISRLNKLIVSYRIFKELQMFAHHLADIDNERKMENANLECHMLENFVSVWKASSIQWQVWTEETISFRNSYRL